MAFFSKKVSPFNLLRWYGVLSFVCIVLISTISGFLLSEFLTKNMLERDGLITMQFVQSLTKAAHGSIYFEEADDGEAKRVFENLFKRISAMPEVVRVKAYNKQGRVLWSDDARLIGHSFMPNPELMIALSGTLAVTSGYSGKPAKGEHVFDENVPYFAEVYLPIWNTRGDKVVGAFEIYKTPATLSEAIKKGNQLIWLSAGLGGLFLFAVLYWIVKRATHTIYKQQQQLVESETMVAIGEMSSAVAHAIRNPLAAIRSSAEVALESHSPQPYPEIAKDIILEVDRITGWIGELLAYAQLSFGTSSAIQINDVIRSTFETLERKMNAREIELFLDLQETLPKIKADEAPLRHVLINLVHNAIDAMPVGGKIFAKSSYLRDEGCLEISIRDTGTGVPKDQIKKVFKPFYTTKRTGTGVGLSLVKRIIRRYNGKVFLESEAGRGTTVRIRIPLATLGKF